MSNKFITNNYPIFYKYADPYEIKGSPFAVTCFEPVPDEPKKSNDTTTDWATLLKNWFLDNWFSVVLVIALVYVSYLHFIKKPDPPQVDDKPKDDCSKEMIVILE